MLVGHRVRAEPPRDQAARTLEARNQRTAAPSSTASSKRTFRSSKAWSPGFHHGRGEPEQGTHLSRTAVVVFSTAVRAVVRDKIRQVNPVHCPFTAQRDNVLPPGTIMCRQLHAKARRGTHVSRVKTTKPHRRTEDRPETCEHNQNLRMRSPPPAQTSHFSAGVIWNSTPADACPLVQGGASATGRPAPYRLRWHTAPPCATTGSVNGARRPDRTSNPRLAKGVKRLDWAAGYHPP